VRCSSSSGMGAGSHTTRRTNVLIGFLRNQGAAASQAVNPKLIQILRTLVIEW
jgi:hypothetical protein